ncbi:hypothetical protein B0H13DRAFT_1897579 [Mycena leptocephala]|nr:hypothetical protein B0H13DRAFT_1897579 [Mycena leptocephala]
MQHEVTPAKEASSGRRAVDQLFSTRGFRARRQLRDWDDAGGVVEMPQAREVAHNYARQLALRYSTCVFRARRYRLGTGVAPVMTMTRYHRPAGSTHPFHHPRLVLHCVQRGPRLRPTRTYTQFGKCGNTPAPVTHTAFTECKEALEIEVLVSVRFNTSSPRTTVDCALDSIANAQCKMMHFSSSPIGTDAWSSMHAHCGAIPLDCRQLHSPIAAAHPFFGLISG